MYPSSEDTHSFIRELRGASKEVWVALALEFYSEYYRMDGEDHTHSEWRRLKALKKALRITLPSVYKEGVHLIGQGMASCGEDIYVVDGELDHSLWVPCAKCEEFEVVHRGEQVWCVPCKAYTEIKRDE